MMRHRQHLLHRPVPRERERLWLGACQHTHLFEGALRTMDSSAAPLETTKVSQEGIRGRNESANGQITDTSQSAVSGGAYVWVWPCIWGCEAASASIPSAWTAAR